MQNRNLLAWREHHHEQSAAGGLGALGAGGPSVGVQHQKCVVEPQHAARGRQPLLALPASSSGNARVTDEGRGRASSSSSRSPEGMASSKRPPAVSDLDAKRLTSNLLPGHKHQAVFAAKENAQSDAVAVRRTAAAGSAIGAPRHSVRVSLDQIIDELSATNRTETAL